MFSVVYMCSTDPVMAACSFAHLGYTHSSSKANVSSVAQREPCSIATGWPHRHWQDAGTDLCLKRSPCYTQFPLPPHYHAVCGLPELVSRTHYLICTICNDWRQLCRALLNIYCQEYAKVIYLTHSKLPRCEFLVAGTLCAFPPLRCCCLRNCPIWIKCPQNDDPCSTVCVQLHLILGSANRRALQQSE